MSWAHSEIVLVTDYGGYTPYPCLDHVTDARFKSVANGGQCQTSDDLAYYDRLTGALLQFEIELHDFTTGEVSAWVGCSPLQPTFVRKWGDAGVVATLAAKPTLWSEYLTPATIPGPSLSATGFVFHCHDNAATATVVNSVVGSVQTCAFRLGDHTDAASVASQFGRGLSFTGSAGNNGLVVSPDVLDYSAAPNDNEQVTIQIAFTIPTDIGSGFLALTDNQYFAEAGYFLAITPGGGLRLYSSGASGQYFDTANGLLVNGASYWVTAVIDHRVGALYIGRTLVASGPLDRPYAAPGNYALSGFYPNAGYWSGTIDEWRMVASLVPQRSIPPIPDDDYEDPCLIKTPILIRIIRTLFDNYDPASGGDTFASATVALRDHAYLGSDYKPARLLQWGPSVKAASHWLTGAFEAQTTPATLADTDHAIRTFIASHQRSLFASEFSDYLVSPTWRATMSRPRLVAQGRLTLDELSAALTVTTTGRDILGADYGILQDETMIPQRLIYPDFPGFGFIQNDTGGLGFLAVPIVAGTHIETGKGRVPVIYAGKQMCLDSVLRHCGIVSGHANHLGIVEMYDTTSPVPVAVTWGTNAWGPGQTGWATVNPTGAALYTILNGRTYTLVFFDDTLGDQFAAGSLGFFVDTHGFCVNGDGTGGEVTDLHDQFLIAMANFFLGDWQTGAWFDETTLQFEFSPGSGEWIDRFDAASWATAQAVWAGCYLATGAPGAWVLGANGTRQAIRSVLAQFCVQTHSSLGVNEFQQYFLKTLDLRTDSHADARRVTHRDHTLSSTPLTAAVLPDLLANNLEFAWDQNLRTTTHDGHSQIGSIAGGTRFTYRRGAAETYDLIADDELAFTLANERLFFRSGIRVDADGVVQDASHLSARRLIKWRESLCGLHANVLDVIRLTHYNGDGSLGYADRYVWIQRQTLNQNATVDFEGYDIDDLMTAGAVDRVIRLGGAGDGASLDEPGAPGSPGLF